MIEAACNDLRPPPRSRAMATAPSRLHQNTRWATGGSSFPPADVMSMTSEPESDDVTKKIIRRTTLANEASCAIGSTSSILNSASSGFHSVIIWDTPVYPSKSSWWMAVAPKTLIHSKEHSAGRRRTQIINSRTVRPLEMRAMNIPTNGVHEIHQAQ